MNITNIEWQCRHCRTQHIDDYARTSFVVCPDCGRIYQWDDVLSTGELQDMESSMFSLENACDIEALETTGKETA